MAGDCVTADEQAAVDVPGHLVTMAAEHLEEAHDRLVEASEVIEQVERTQRSSSDLVELAHVHARIAHAATALAMLEPRSATREQVDADAPGLAAIERLAAAIERLADAETR